MYKPQPHSAFDSAYIAKNLLIIFSTVGTNIDGESSHVTHMKNYTRSFSFLLLFYCGKPNRRTYKQEGPGNKAIYLLDSTCVRVREPITVLGKSVTMYCFIFCFVTF